MLLLCGFAFGVFCLVGGNYCLLEIEEVEHLAERGHWKAPLKSRHCSRSISTSLGVVWGVLSLCVGVGRAAWLGLLVFVVSLESEPGELL